jgi:hypothetical protein
LAHIEATVWDRRLLRLKVELEKRETLPIAEWNGRLIVRTPKF